MKTSPRLCLALIALAGTLSLLGCQSKEAEPTTPPATTTPAESAPATTSAPPAAPGGASGSGRASMEKALNDPNTPAAVKAQIRQQMGGGH